MRNPVACRRCGSTNWIKITRWDTRIDTLDWTETVSPVRVLEFRCSACDTKATIEQIPFLSVEREPLDITPEQAEGFNRLTCPDQDDLSPDSGLRDIPLEGEPV